MSEQSDYLFCLLKLNIGNGVSPLEAVYNAVDETAEVFEWKKGVKDKPVVNASESLPVTEPILQQ